MTKKAKEPLDGIVFFRLRGEDKKRAEREAKKQGFESVGAWFRSLLLKQLSRAA